MLQRKRFLFSLLLSAITAAGIAGRPLWAAPPEVDIVRVEEDWELVVEAPDAANTTPEVTTTMAPTEALTGPRWLLTLNAQSQPGLATGGVVLTYWRQNTPRTESRAKEGVPLHFAGETITWTQSLAIDRGTLTCQIQNGHSQSWGDFPERGTLSVSAATDLRNLNRYAPDVSYYNSGVSGRNLAPARVRTLTLRAVRFYTRDGRASERVLDALVY